MSYLPHLVVLAERASHARRNVGPWDAWNSPPCAVPELRDILLSTS